MSTPAVVTTEWLAARLGHPRLHVVDGTWHMRELRRDARAEFAETHIAGAVFFDIDAIADTSTSLPHMLPDGEIFAESVGALGIGDDDLVVAYDTRGVVSGARVWWTFRAFGHDAVAVLDGGLPKWRAEGRPVESGAGIAEPRRFTAHPRPELVRDLAQVRANLTSGREQVVDARSAGRFAGTEPEPRPGLRGGHIPGSVNLPYEGLSHPADGTMLPPGALREAFEKAGVDLTRPIITTCGSGITAAVLAFGLHLIGHRETALYDGSWTEWGGRADTPVEV